MTVHLEGYILVPSTQIAEIRAALAVHIQTTRNEVGCLRFEVIEDTSRPGRFNVSEDFVDREAFEAHQTRVKASDWGRISAGIPRYYNIKYVP